MNKSEWAVIGCIFSGALLTSISAQADWQYTKWGMSPEQVIATSNGAAHAIPDAEVKKYWGSDRYISALVKATHTVDGERFDVSFLFTKTSRRLQRVDLFAANFSNCHSYKFSLLDKYGSPAYKDSQDDLMVWRDLPSGNAIDWLHTASVKFCHIRFSPIDSDFVKAL